uniref:RING-type E3 ubiquitin transferase n=1 Tax=Kalanchoe fedtschenkoi TaxID=63787 RepID=A0A7N0TPV2_KALFE
MQGHRSSLGSSTGTIEFDHAAAASSGVISAEIFWNDRLLPEILPSAGSTGVTHYGSAGPAGQNLSLWNQGEAGSSSVQNAAGCSEQKLENGWPSASLNSGAVTGFEEWFNSPAYFSQDNNNPNLGGSGHIVNRPLTLRSLSTEASRQTSNADASAQNLNLNVRVSGPSSDHSQFVESRNLYRSGFSGSGGQRPVGPAAHSFPVPSNGSHLMGDNARRFDSSHDVCRLPCKRKIMDEDIGQSSASGSSRSYQHAEGSSWHPVPVDSSDTGLNIAGSHGQLHPIYGLSSRAVVSESLPDVSPVDNARINSRNLRLRLSSSVQPSAPVSIGLTGGAFTLSNDGGIQHPNASLPPPHLPFVAAPEGSNQQAHPAAPHVALPRNGQSFRRSRGSSSRSASSSGVVIGGERGEAQRAEATLRMSRQLLERHMRAHQLMHVSRSRNIAASRGSGSSPAIIPSDPVPAPLPIPALGSEHNAAASTPAGRTWGPGHSFSSGQRIAEIELLALEERIGNVSTGLTEEAVMKCLKQREFVPAATPSEEETEPCCICQEEYSVGDNLGILDCGHSFHRACVKQWLMVKNLCPICKTTGLASK